MPCGLEATAEAAKHAGDGSLSRLPGQVLLHALPQSRTQIGAETASANLASVLAPRGRSTRAAHHGLGALTFAFIDQNEAAKVGGRVLRNHQVGRLRAARPYRERQCRHGGWLLLPRRRGGSAPPRFSTASASSATRLAITTSSGSTPLAAPTSGPNTEQARDLLPVSPGAGGIGTPEQIAENMRRFEEAGVDQVVFLQQGGKQRACPHLRLAGAVRRAVMPAFKQRQASREQKKQEEVAPYIERALARRTLRLSLRDEEIPAIVALGQQRAQQESLDGRDDLTPAAGGEMQVPLKDPLKKIAT